MITLEHSLQDKPIPQDGSKDPSQNNDSAENNRTIVPYLCLGEHPYTGGIDQNRLAVRERRQISQGRIV